MRISELLKNALNEGACFKHPVAALIETADNYIMGWNGPPIKIEHNECLRKGYASGEGMHLCPTIHAERRAISRAARVGYKTSGGSIYLNEWFPCADCAKSIIEAGLIKLITPDEVYSNKDTYELIPKLRNQPYNFEMAEKLLREAGIEIIIDPSIKVLK